MKVRKHITIHKEDIFNFLAEHTGETVIINSTSPLEFIIEFEQTVPQMHMEELRHLVSRATDCAVDLSDEEIAALEYAIECIKTLDDMGIIKENKDDD